MIFLFFSCVCFISLHSTVSFLLFPTTFILLYSQSLLFLVTESLPLSLYHCGISPHPNPSPFPIQHMVSPILSFLMGTFFLSCSRRYISIDRNATLTFCSFTSCFIYTMALAESYHMLQNQSTQGLDLVISHTNHLNYFLPASHVGVLWVCILCPFPLGWGSWPGQCRSSLSRSFLGSSYRLPRPPFSWHSGQKHFSMEKEKIHKVCREIFKTLYSWTIQEPHRSMHKQEHLWLSRNRSLSFPPQWFCRFDLWLRQLHCFALLYYSCFPRPVHQWRGREDMSGEDIHLLKL